MENQQPPMPFHNVPSQSTCPKPLVDNQIPTISITRLSPEEVGIQNIQIKTEDEIIEEYELMLPRLELKNAIHTFLAGDQMYHLVSPERALMAFSDLLQGAKMKIQKHPENHLNCMSYTATLTIDSQMYTANDISTAGARGKACQKFLRNMFVKKCVLSENEKSSTEIKMKDRENDSMNEFLWDQFIKLTMHNLITQWKTQNDSKVLEVQDEMLIGNNKVKKKKIPQFPEDPSKYHPSQLLYKMKSEVEFIHTNRSIGNWSQLIHQTQCVIDEVLFVGTGPSKKDAKRECCIQAIKHFWKFDFHTIAEYSIKLHTV